jgi:hypothetical protein
MAFHRERKTTAGVLCVMCLRETFGTFIIFFLNTPNEKRSSTFYMNLFLDFNEFGHSVPHSELRMMREGRVKHSKELEAIFNTCDIRTDSHYWTFAQKGKINNR